MRAIGVQLSRRCAGDVKERQVNTSQRHSNSNPPMFQTPSQTRGDVNRGVVYLDRFPGAVREMSSLSIVQRKLHDLAERSKQPNMRDSFYMHTILCDLVDSQCSQYRHIIQRGNSSQIEQLYRTLRAMHVSVNGAA